MCVGGGGGGGGVEVGSDKMDCREDISVATLCQYLLLSEPVWPSGQELDW